MVGSLYVRVPSVFCEVLGVGVGDEVELELRDGGFFVRKKG